MTLPRLILTLAAGVTLLAAAACNSPSTTPSPVASVSAPPLAASAPPSASARAAAAGADGQSCFDFYYGISIARDLPRARACFEHKVGVDKTCGGGASPDLDRLYLAAMLVDAQGGGADPSRATALLADCFADASVAGIRDEVTKRAALSPSRAPLDFCKDIGGTTLTMGACHTLDADRFVAARRRVEREVGAKLDPESKPLADKARDLWSAFARLEGEAFGDKYRGGTLRSNASAGHENEIEQQRLDALGHLFEYSPAAGDPVSADRDLDKAYRAAASGDADHQRLFAAAREAWRAYRDAEVALYVHLFGPKLDERAVKRDVAAMLARRYQALLEEAVKP